MVETLQMDKLCCVLLEMSESEDPWLMSGASPSKLCLCICMYMLQSWWASFMAFLEKCESNIYKSAVLLLGMGGRGGEITQYPPPPLRVLFENKESSFSHETGSSDTVK